MHSSIISLTGNCKMQYVTSLVRGLNIFPLTALFCFCFYFVFNVALYQICLVHLSEVIVDGDNILDIFLRASACHGNGDGITTLISLPLFLTILILTMVTQVSRVSHRNVISFNL